MTGSGAVRLLLAVLLGVTVTCVGGSVGSAANAQDSAGGGCVAAPTRHLELRTKPVMPGFRFRLAGHVYTTGREGKAVLAPVTCTDWRRALAPLTLKVQPDDRTRARFDGWYSDQVLGRSGDGVVWASFAERSRVAFSFENRAGQEVDRSKLGDVTLRGSTGSVMTLRPGADDLWLDSARVVRFSTGLVVKDILWSLQSADMDGNSVVTRGSLRFKPRSTPAVRVRLLLFPLTLVVRDAVLHRPVGRQVTITAPDGQRRTVELGADGRADVGLIGRGHYSLRAHGSNVVVAFNQPVAMSRSQDAELTVVSGWDIAIVSGVGLAVAAGLVVVGRRTRRRHLATASADLAPAAPGRLP